MPSSRMGAASSHESGSGRTPTSRMKPPSRGAPRGTVPGDILHRDETKGVPKASYHGPSLPRHPPTPGYGVMNLPEAETMTNEGPTPVEPKKGSGGKIAAVVIVIILIAAIGLYFLYKPAPPTTPPPAPLAVLARSGSGSGCELDHCDARVESVSIAYGHELYKVSALNGSTVAIAPTPLSTSPVSGGGLSLQLNDVSVAGQLNANDTFRLSGAAPGLNYTVRLLWASDNGVLASVTFDYPLPKPTLVLAPAGCSADYCDAVVQSVTLT